MRTIQTKQQQKETIGHAGHIALVHKWSTRGYGSSRISFFDSRDPETKHKECKRGGYDRFGAVLGDVIEELFPAELNKLARKVCKGKRLDTRKQSETFCGLFYNAKEKRAYVDGACGTSSMGWILAAIGYELISCGSDGSRGYTGSDFYILRPLTKGYIKDRIRKLKL